MCSGFGNRFNFRYCWKEKIPALLAPHCSANEVAWILECSFRRGFFFCKLNALASFTRVVIIYGSFVLGALSR